MAKAGRMLIVLGIDVTQFERDVRKFQARLGRMSRQMASAGRGLTVGLTAPILAVGGSAVRASIQFEDAFAKVRKTVTTTEQGFGELEAGIRAMSQEIPVSASHIAEVASALGQVNVQKEDLLEITKAMLQLGETSNLVATEGGQALAQFANIVRLPQKEIPKLANAVSDLGTNSATTERDIVNMAVRMAGAANAAGLTTAATLALATGLGSLRIRAEAGGTAISRVLQEMKISVEQGGERLEAFAEVAGQSAKDFQKAFRDDAGQATIAFIEGLGKMKNEGARIFEVLNDLDFGAIRVKTALINSAGASDVMRAALARANVAIETTNFLTEKSTERWSTTGSELKKVRNQFAEINRQLGDQLAPVLLDFVKIVRDELAPSLRSWVEGFASLEKSTQVFIIKAFALTAALGPLLIVLGSAINVIRGFSTALLLLLNNPVLRASAAILGLIAIIGSFSRETDTAADAAKAFSDGMDLIEGAADRARERLRRLLGVQKKVKELQSKRSGLIQAQDSSRSGPLEGASLVSGAQLSAVKEINAEISALRKSLGGLTEETARGNVALGELSDLESTTAQRLAVSSQKATLTGDAMQHYALAVSLTSAVLEKNIEVLGSQHSATLETAATLEDYKAKLEVLRDAHAGAATGVDSLTKSTLKSHETFVMMQAIAANLGSTLSEQLAADLEQAKKEYTDLAIEAVEAGLAMDEALSIEADGLLAQIALMGEALEESLAADRLQEQWQGFFDSMGLNVTNLSQEFQSFAKSMSNNLGRSFAESVVMGESFGDSFEKLWIQMLMTVVQNLGAMAVEELAVWALKQGLLGAELAAFLGVKTTEAAAETTSVWTGAAAWVAALPVKLATLATELAAALSTYLSIAYAAIVAGWSSIPFVGWAIGIGVAAAVVAGILAATGSFASGGTAIGPQLAVVGDNPSRREHIIPDEMMKEFGLADGARGGQVINFWVDRRLLAQQVMGGMPDVVDMRLGGGA